MNAEEQSLKMEELTIQILPEYAYHPEDKEKEHLPVLIGYHGTLKNVTDKPQKRVIKIPLPEDSENLRIGYVAEYNRDHTERHEIDYEIDEEKSIISWETGEEVQPEELYKFVIEFYTNDLVVKDDKREMTYTFEKFTDSGMINIIFLEPLRSEKFKLTPAAESHQQNPYGMNMFYYQGSKLKLNEKKTIQLQYERDEEKMTVELFDEMYESVNGVQEQENKTMSPSIVIAVIASVSAVAILILLFFLRKNSNKKKQDKNKKIKNNYHIKNEKSEQELKLASLRSMLVNGEITEDEYKALLKKLGG